ncbi:MAG: RNA polymerase sigma factor [Bacteroidales bacterium]|nr:RNA polymerase sigma factor [Bacteroidales bacterium]
MSPTHNIPDEQELVQAILNGDKQRYSEIVRCYSTSIANLSYKLAGEKLEVEEVVQEVLVELYLSLPRFRFGSKLSTYVYRITVNTVAKKLKKLGRYYRMSEVTENTNIQLRQNSVEESIVNDDRQNELLKALGQLKYEQRTALTLFYYEELSYKEIAETMNITVAKAESLIFRAKQNLKKKLDKQ